MKPKRLLVDSCDYCGIEETFTVDLDRNGSPMEYSCRTDAGWHSEQVGKTSMWLCPTCSVMWEEAVEGSREWALALVKLVNQETGERYLVQSHCQVHDHWGHDDDGLYEWCYADQQKCYREPAKHAIGWSIWEPPKLEPGWVVRLDVRDEHHVELPILDMAGAPIDALLSDLLDYPDRVVGYVYTLPDEQEIERSMLRTQWCWPITSGAHEGEWWSSNLYIDSTNDGARPAKLTHVLWWESADD